MGEGVEDFGVGGSNPPHFREFFKGSGTSKTPVHSIIMGDITSDLDEPGWFPPQGGPSSGNMYPKRDVMYRWIYLPLDVSMNKVGI